MSDATTVEKQQEPGTSGSIGMVQGIPGRKIDSVGVLDLRGVKPEEVAQIESISSVGVVLIDDALRTAMTKITTDSVGSVIAVEKDYRILVEPFLELSKETVEAMPDGQKFILVGIALFKPDVPAELIAAKFADLKVVGVVLSTAGVKGALLGKMEVTGVSVTIPDGGASVVTSLGDNKITPGYLSHLQDGTTYINIGRTQIESDVTEELLARKFSHYCNVGQTVAPAPLLDLLKARCQNNLGEFTTPEEETEEES